MLFPQGINGIRQIYKLQHALHLIETEPWPLIMVFRLNPASNHFRHHGRGLPMHVSLTDVKNRHEHDPTQTHLSTVRTHNTPTSSEISSVDDQVQPSTLRGGSFGRFGNGAFQINHAHQVNNAKYPRPQDKSSHHNSLGALNQSSSSSNPQPRGFDSQNHQPLCSGLFAQSARLPPCSAEPVRRLACCCCCCCHSRCSATDACVAYAMYV